jgi:hypothetical protein
VDWLNPWWSTAGKGEHFHEVFAAQLKLEIGADDPIHGIPAKIIGRGEGDDALFQLLDGTGRVAFVHLQWGKPPGGPDVKFRTRSKVYQTLEGFFEQHMLPEHEDWVAARDT